MKIIIYLRNNDPIDLIFDDKATCDGFFDRLKTGLLGSDDNFWFNDSNIIRLKDVIWVQKLTGINHKHKASCYDSIGGLVCGF